MLPVKINGISISGGAIIEEGEPWHSRSQAVARRLADDSKGFDIISLTGKRTFVQYNSIYSTPTQLPVADNNDEVLELIYKKSAQRRYTITGEGLPVSEIATFLEHHKTAQQMWVKKAWLKTMLTAQDISYEKISELADAYDSLVQPSAVTFEYYNGSISGIFAEGSSCRFTVWTTGTHCDFSFEIIA